MPQRITTGATASVLAVSHRLGPRGAFAIGRVAGQVAGLTWLMRKRLATNLRHAGITPTTAQIDSYFRRFGSWVSWSLAVYHHGFTQSGVAERILLDPSVLHLDQAIALGRGAILVCPHVFCHESGAAAINRQRPLTAIVRESKDPGRDRMKRRWYQATGIETVYRSRGSSLMADTVAYLRALRRGRVLAITPDILVSPDKGVPVRLFGRQVFLSPGMVVLALKTGAPLVTCWGEWREDASNPHNDRVVIRFDEPIQLRADGKREEQAREVLQAWCNRFESHLRERPENWMFWLDKRWTRVLRNSAA